MIKIGIGVTLMGIIVGLWMRVDSLKVAPPDLKASAEREPVKTAGEIDTDYGRAEISARAPEPLWIHKLAERMSTPLLVMGPMVVAEGGRSRVAPRRPGQGLSACNPAADGPHPWEPSDGAAPRLIARAAELARLDRLVDREGRTVARAESFGRVRQSDH